MEINNVTLEVRGNLGVITIDRPKALNAINEEMLKEISTQAKEMDEDPLIRVIILRGSEKAFAAGIDVKDLMTKLGQRKSALARMQDYMQTFAAIRKPIVAAVSGFALGIGCELVLNSDIVLAADNAKFGLPELSLGMIPSFGGTQKLTKIIGKSKAMEMILSGRAMTAEEAERAGLVSRIIPLPDLEDEAFKTAGKIAAQAEAAVNAAKGLIKSAAAGTELSAGLEAENLGCQMCLESPDFQEALRKLAEKPA